MNIYCSTETITIITVFFFMKNCVNISLIYSFFRLISTSIDTGFTGVSTDITSRLSGPNTPMTPSSIEMGPRFPSTTASSDGCRYQIASPQTSSSGNQLPSSSGNYTKIYFYFEIHNKKNYNMIFF